MINLHKNLLLEILTSALQGGIGKCNFTIGNSSVFRPSPKSCNKALEKMKIDINKVRGNT